MLRKILLVFVIIQCLTFFVIHSTFAEEDNLSQPDMTDGEKNIALVGNFVPNEYGLKVLENIEKNNPEHIFFLGDLGYDTPENWFAFSDRLGKERISVVIGNHDRENAKEILGHYGLNREFYSIDYENIHFIILASDLDYTKNSEQMKFLEDDLVKANNNSKIKWKIVLIHKPMIYKDYYVKNDPGLTNGVALKEGLQPTLDAYGVDMIISGHAHLYERSFPLKFNNVLTSNEKSTYIDPEGAIHVIVGTAGADKHHNQYPQTFEEWAVVKNPDVYGFFNLRIPDDKNRLIFEFITNEGYVLDRFQIFETDDSFKTKLDVLSGADLTNADLSGADLTNADLSGADLTNADLFGADLTNANLSFTNLKNIDFSNVKIKDVKFIGVTFTDMDLSGLDLSEKNLAGSSFLRTNLSEANLEKSNLSWANFEQVNLFNTNLKHAELLRANLSEADLSNTELEYSNLMNSNLSKIDFSNVKLTNVKLEKTNLSYSNFSNVDLTGMNLNGANLYGVHLIGKDLRNTNLKNANFIGYKIDDEKWWDYLGLNRNGGIIDHAGVDKFGEKLYGTDLSGVDLRGADLSGVNLSGIDITHANLSDLDFSNTNIERANLAKTDLSGADLSGKNLSQVNLSGADLSGADLTNADFTDMNFFKFQFFGTDLSGADLTNADLSGADLAWGFFYGLDLSGTILECYNHSICK